MNMKKILSNYMMDMGLVPGKEKVDRILSFLKLIYDENRNINLVGTKDREQIFIRHFLDCISIYKYFYKHNIDKSDYLRIIDVGSGAGLPGILIALLNKNFDVTLLDSKKKYINFLVSIKSYLSLDNARIVEARAEDFSHSIYRESFDIVVSRAVSRMNYLCELMIPLCKIGGKIVMYKSKKAITELDESRKAISLLGADFDRIYEVDVPHLNEFRALVILNKSYKTPYIYPRKYAKIKKMPLM